MGNTLDCCQRPKRRRTDEHLWQHKNPKWRRTDEHLGRRPDTHCEYGMAGHLGDQAPRYTEVQPTLGVSMVWLGTWVIKHRGAAAGQAQALSLFSFLHRVDRVSLHTSSSP